MATSDLTGASSVIDRPVAPSVRRLLGDVSTWLGNPHRGARLDNDRLLSVLRIYARKMHGCRQLGIDADRAKNQHRYLSSIGSTQGWQEWQDAEALSGLAEQAAVDDMNAAFTVLTSLDPTDPWTQLAALLGTQSIGDLRTTIAAVRGW